MTPGETRPAPACPACAAPIEAARGGRVVGGVPTSAEIESTRVPFADRAAARRGGFEGALRCGACGETLIRLGASLLRHRGVAPVITMAMAADRLRNHLRRRAIVRPGRIDGDCYLLPFVRFEGATPEGDETFTILAASIGEERLETTFLHPADVRPWEPPSPGAAGPSGAGDATLRILPPTLYEGALRARAAARGWSVTRSVELIHYPFWLMRVEDSGRLEGAWMDGIEGKMIFHRLLLPSPLPSTRKALLVAAVPAIAASLAGVVMASPAAGLAAGAAAWVASIPLLHGTLLRSWRG